MKKSLLSCILILLFTSVGFAQQGRLNNYSSVGDNAYSSNTTASNPKGSQAAVITTTTSTCMSINLPAPATWSLVNYGTGSPTFAQDGFVSGPNIYLDKEKAMYFDVSASANASITHVYVGFSHAYSATQTKTVALKIYDGTTTNVVGALLGITTLTMGEIMADVAASQYSDFYFPVPINLPASKKFYASVDVTGLAWGAIKDSLSIVSNTHPQSTPSPAWEKQSNNVWYNYSNSVSSWSLNISLLIHPFLVQSPVLSNFTISSNSICAGQSTNYNSAGSTTGGTVFWDFGTIPTPTSNLTAPSITYPSSGTFTTYLLVNDACGSYALSTKTVLVKPNPTVGANITSTNVCSGTNITLSGTGASTYLWTGGITNSVPFAANSSINYTVTGTASNGCTNTAVSSVVVAANPTVTINSSTLSVCSGNSVTLSGAGAGSYVWTGGVSNGIAFAPSSTNSYTVTGTQGICSGTAAVNVTVNNNPTVTASASSSLICTGSSVTVSGGGATTYTWTGGVTDATPFTPTATANYVVTGIGSNSCTATATVNVAVSLCTGIAANTINSNIQLYPNPNNGSFTIESIDLSQAATVVIYDNIGKLVYQQNLVQSTTLVNTNLAAGVYTVKIIDLNTLKSVHKLIMK